MRRYLLGGLLLLASSTGCKMCCCPYDDCYPVVESYPMQGGPEQGAVEQGPVEGPADYQGDGAPAVEEQQSMQPHGTPHLARPNRPQQQESY